MQTVEVKLMKYGDLSSLAVEYPDYNSLGATIASIQRIQVTHMAAESYKFQERIQLP